MYNNEVGRTKRTTFTSEGDKMNLLDHNESKKKMAQLYNEVSKELFGYGTTLLRVTVEDHIITFQARHRRSPRSAALEGEDPALKQEVDFRLSTVYKRKFREKLELELQLNIEAILRDYDASTQWAFTNVVLAENQ